MFTTEEIIKATKAKTQCPSLTFASVSQNSKEIKPQELFIAIQGERFDGHSFLKEVFDKGVQAAVIQKGKINPQHFPEKFFFEVQDTVQALGDLAHFHRKRFSIPIIAITGSNGKTTTKELIAKVLEQKFSVLKTKGNLNNLIGLPFMLFRLKPSHEIAVLEMGMSLPFEIKRLCEIAEPTAGLITNIGRAHLAFMKSPQKILKAKGALFESLPEDGVAFININDPFLKPFAARGKPSSKKLKCKRQTYRLLHFKDLGLKGIKLKYKHVSFELPLTGVHNALNATAAITVGSYFGVDLKKLKKALLSFKPTQGRSHLLRLKNNIVLIDDSYNANPDSMAAAIKMLKSLSNGRKTYVVLGDMLELGAKEKQYHEELGRIISKNEFYYVLTLGRLSQYIERAAAKNKGIKTYWTLDQNELILKLKQELRSNSVILIKGSHGMRMDKVVLALIEFFKKGK